MPEKRIIAVSGANGQLGMALKEISPLYKDYDFVFTDVAGLDISKKEALEVFFTQYKPAFFINCAAYTAVDKAEEQEELARLLNGIAPGYIAETCQKHQCRLLHVSTDYVFDGTYYRPYPEQHQLSPNSAYGRSKLLGEQNVLTYCEDVIIVRTSWLYSTTGHNFVKTMRKYGAERDMLKVVFDQVGTPTYAPDLAKALLALVQKSEEIEGAGIYHFSNEGVCSWYDFAKEIIELSGIECIISPVETKDYPLPANRPHFSVLNKEKIKNDTGIEIPYWKDSLKECLRILDENEK